MYRERNYANTPDMPEYTNPVYRARLEANPLADTPLFEAAVNGYREPPRTLKRSRTQRESFEKLLPHITRKQQTVLDAIKRIGPATTLAISKELNWSINLVSGRIAELQQQGYVAEGGSVLNLITNRRNSLWKAL